MKFPNTQKVHKDVTSKKGIFNDKKETIRWDKYFFIITLSDLGRRKKKERVFKVNNKVKRENELKKDKINLT